MFRRYIPLGFVVVCVFPYWAVLPPHLDRGNVDRRCFLKYTTHKLQRYSTQTNQGGMFTRFCLLLMIRAGLILLSRHVPLPLLTLELCALKVPSRLASGSVLHLFRQSLHSHN